MSTSPVTGYTTNLQFNLVSYLAPVGLIQKYEQQNWSRIDVFLGNFLANGDVKLWTTGTVYGLGVRALDSDGSLFICQVPHTSPGTGTFSQARALNPSYWLGYSKANQSDLVALQGTVAGHTTAIANNTAAIAANSTSISNNLALFNAHVANVSNPHSTTAAQVGLGNVNNTSDANKPVSTAQLAALNLKTDLTVFNAHTGNTSNPHSTTAAQVGLGNVDNTSDVNKPVSTAAQTALNGKLSLLGNVSETVTGAKTFNSIFVPTVAATDNSTAPASTAWVRGALGRANVNWYRLAGDPDDTLCINRAAATGLAVYLPDIGREYIVSSDINIGSKNNQLIYGDGRNRTAIRVRTASAAGFVNGVFNLFPGEQGPCIDGLSVIFDQPDSPSLAAYTQYKPAFYVAATPRTTIKNVGIYHAWHGIKLFQNCGGTTLDDVQIGAYQKGISIDGCLDTVRMSMVHCFPYFATTNQLWVMTTNVTWIFSGRCDDLKIDQFLSLGGIASSFVAGAAGGRTTAEFSNSSLDGAIIGITATVGIITFTGGYMSGGSGTSAATQLVQANGTSMITVEGAWVGVQTQDNAASNIPFFSSGGGALIIANCMFDKQTVNVDKPILSYSSGFCTFSGNDVLHNPNTAYTNPLVYCAGGRLVAIGNTVNDKGTGAGNFITVLNDDHHRVLGNTGPGWTFNFPATGTIGVYQGNMPSELIRTSGINSSCTLTPVANGGTLALPPGSGRVTITDNDNGNVGDFLIGGGIVVLCNQLGTQYVVSNAPAAGKIGLLYDSSTQLYRIYNNKGSTFNVGYTPMLSRASV